MRIASLNLMRARIITAIIATAILGISAAPATALETSDYIVTLKSNSALKDPVFSGKAFKDRWTHAVNAVRISLSSGEARILAANSSVAAVERNQKRTIETTQTINPNHNIDNWALDALEGGAPAIDGQYNYTTTGSGVTVAVVDTGVFPNADLGSRLVLAKNFVDGANGSGSAKDCNGHGTHVASIAAGTQFGVAKGASVYNLRVLDCYGSGWDSDIIDALDWLAANKPSGRTVVNMSLGGDGGAYGITAAVDRLISGGVPVAVAAGNESVDACGGMIIPKDGTNKPTPGVLTIGAYASNSDVSWFSNYGSCVDLFAPGSGILSRTLDYDPYTYELLIDPNTNDFIPINEAWNGTSMATPVVAGAVARYLQYNASATPAQIENTMVVNALEGAIDFSGSDSWDLDPALLQSPNLMLDYTNIELPYAAASISAPSSLVYGQSGTFTITDDYVADPTVSVTGPCHISGDSIFADYGVGSCALSASFAAEESVAGRTVVANIRLELAVATVGNPVTEPGWNYAFILPQKQTLSLSANPTKVTGGCKVNRLVLTASGSSGKCTLEYKSFSDGYFAYPKTTVNIKLGASTQSWSSKVTKGGVLRYSSRPLQLSALLNPVTNYGNAGTWSSVTGPCTLDRSSSRAGVTVTHNGVRGQTCTVSLSAPGAFKLPTLTNTWTITR